MARSAAFRFYRLVLEGEWSRLVGVTLEADLVLRRRRAQGLAHETAVLIVAIRAQNQPLVHAMPKRALEVLLDLGMAAVAELRLLLHQQELPFFGVVRGMARDATYLIRTVLRATEVGVFFAIFVAGEAAPADFARIGAGKVEDLAFIASAFDVILARSMACFTTQGPAPLAAQSRLPVASRFELLIDVLVTTLACIGTGILRGFNLVF